MGILQAFRATGLHTPNGHREAIDLATTYLVSSVDDPGRGQGLSTTIEQVTSLRGQIVVRTGNARVEHASDGVSVKKVTPMAGTLVAISLPLQAGGE